MKVKTKLQKYRACRTAYRSGRLETIPKRSKKQFRKYQFLRRWTI